MAQSINSKLEDFDNQLSGYLNKTDKLALLLDFDGTLADLTSHPNLTTLREEVRTVLRDLSQHPNVYVSIISGRAVLEVKEKVAIPALTYAGNHGFNILYPDGTKYNYEVPKEVRDNFPKMVAALEEQVVHDGTWVENKKASLTFHYRSMPDALRPEPLKKAREIIERFGYRCSQAHEALEAKPPVDWNKGYAASHILEHEFGSTWKNEVKTIFAGDDTTDEDIMRVIKGFGKSYRVTRGAEVNTVADFTIHDTGDVFMLLKWLKRLYCENN